MLITKNLVSSDDLSKEEILELIDYAQSIIKSPADFSQLCNGKILGTLFFEPSTRTRLSFEAAMTRLGGGVLSVSEASTSSASKGESLADTIKTVSQYVDIIAMRHAKEGSSTLALETSDVPLINAGDGGHQHPTQTLTDLLTIMEAKGRLDNMTIGICGDLKFGRTVHSLIKSMTKFSNNKYILISPTELRVPQYIKTVVLDGNDVDYVEVEKLEDVIDQLDCLYMTRVQKERFFNEADYVRLKDSYRLNNKKLRVAKEDLAILHPLPRVNEISVEVDSDPRALYFKQVKNGMYIRMALILKLLEVANA